MEIIEARVMGFCKGVARAVDMARGAAAEHGVCHTLGPVIHNRAVVGELEQAGVRVADSLDAVPDGGAVVIRSHGAPPEVYRQIERRGLRLYDATCPDVRRVHEIAAGESGAGRTVVILGDAAHPEVAAHAGWCQKPLVVKDFSELIALRHDGRLPSDTPVSFVAQTTACRDDYDLCVNFLKKQYTNAKIFDTICNATLFRQSEAERLAAYCDAMLVVGDPDSANTRHLAGVCKRYCKMVFQVEDARKADKLPIPRNARVGLTAGASTPAGVIKEVKRAMSDENNIRADGEQTFEEMLEQSFKTLTTGDKVSGVITAVTPTEIHVDLGTKHAGYIPVGELSDDPDYKAEEHLRVGESIETFVMRVNDVEGTAMLSKKRVDAVQNWEDIEAARENRGMVEGIVTEENKGGLVVSVRGVRVFIPASQSGVPKDGNLSAMLKKKVRLYITEVNRARRRVVGSIRAAQNDERRLLADEVWNGIEDGKRYNGTVKSLTLYGAFVDIGGVDGMVHVSELSWSRVGHPSEVVKVGDQIEVYVLSFDKEKRKISLGYKDKAQNPWNRFIETFKAGDVTGVKVVKLAPFGAFCEIIPGVDGLIHISHISDRRIGKPGDVLTEGQEVEVKILEINHEHKKISLSIRALMAYERPISPDDEDDGYDDIQDDVTEAQPEPALVFPEVEPAPQASENAENASEEAAKAEQKPAKTKKAAPKKPEAAADEEAPPAVPEAPADEAESKPKPVKKTTRKKAEAAPPAEDPGAPEPEPDKPKRRTKKAEAE